MTTKTDTRHDQRTLTELHLEALAVQDACNLSGVIFSFARTMERLCDLSREMHADGIEFDRNSNPIVRLWASRIMSLTGDIQLSDMNVDE